MSVVASVLPDELTVEILSWIPVKALMRFRCVSKPWNSLMFSTTFVKLHFQRSPRNTRILIDANRLVKSCSLLDLFEDPLSAIDHGCHLAESSHSVMMVCKGLVCLLNFDFVYHEFDEFWVRFWNPATRLMSEESPHFRVYHKSNYSVDLSDQKFGFGYDDRSDTFKVVVVLSNITSQQTELIGYCSGDECWKEILTFHDFPIPGNDLEGKFVNDTINWLVTRPKLSSHHQGKTVTTNQMEIFSFNMKNEKCTYMSMPIHIDTEPRLGVLKGCLCVYHDHMKTHLIVWLMREFGVDKSWTQLFNLSYEHLQAHEAYDKKTLCVPLCMSEDENILLLQEIEDYILIVYNKRDNGIIHSDEGDIYCCADYVQSLFSPY